MGGSGRKIATLLGVDMIVQGTWTVKDHSSALETIALFRVVV